MTADDKSTVEKTGYAVTPDWILDAKISDRAVRLFGVLDRFEGKNETAYPSRKTLADRLHCSVASIDRALAELVEIGAVQTTQRRRGDGSLTSCDYWLWPKTPHDSEDVPSPVIAPLPSRVTQHEVTTVRSNHTEPLLVIEDDRPSIRDQIFNRLWQRYPRKLGKADAKRIILSMLKSDISPDELWEATDNYAMIRTGQDPAYTMHPKTFYSKDRWRDYLNGQEGTKAIPKTEKSMEAAVEKAFMELKRMWSKDDPMTDNPVVAEARKLKTLRQLGMMNETELRVMLKEIARSQ